MRIALIGQAAFAAKVLDGLRERGHEVLAVYCPPDVGERADPVKVRAQELGIPVRQHRSLRSREAQREFAELGADLGVLAYVTQIVPPGIFAAPRLGSICFHPSLLPRYRGGSAINWQIIKGETETGVTIFWVDAGVDTGAILLQRRAEIGSDDTAGSLYYGKLFPLGVEAVLDSVDLVAAGRAPRIPQEEARASYDPLCGDEHGRIDWQKPAREIYNLVRGCDPQPGAYAMYRGDKLRFYAARLISGGTHEPGLVEDIGLDGILVGAGDGAIRAARLRGAGPKATAAEVAAECGLRVGERLG